MDNSLEKDQVYSIVTCAETISYQGPEMLDLLPKVLNLKSTNNSTGLSVQAMKKIHISNMFLVNIKFWQSINQNQSKCCYCY